MQNSWLSLVPPLIVLVAAFWTRHIHFSLMCGIISAALIFTNFSIGKSFSIISYRLWENTELGTLQSWETFWNNWNLFVCIFLGILGIIIALLAQSGGAFAYRNFAKKHIKNRQSAETASLLLSSCLFIDDYFNALTVGTVMHPITDEYNIPRVKLAFLVDSMSAPLSILIPISSWVAAIVLQLRETGISLHKEANTLILGDPFFIYLQSIPFIFYSFIVIAGAWIIVRRNISFGLMGQQELIAQKTNNLFGGKEATPSPLREKRIAKNQSSMYDFLFPVIGLVLSIFIALLSSGDYFLLGGTNSFLAALQNSSAARALFIGSSITLLSSFAYFLYKDKVDVKEIPRLSVEGLKMMGPSILILLLSWTLGNLLREDLLTGQYLAHQLIGTLDIKLFPLMFFLAATATSFTIGSSWGTIAILFPIAIPMIPSFLQLPIPTPIAQLPMLFPTIGAILSGSVVGDHISPISDTTIMSSTSTGSHHIDHVATQMTYATPLFFSSALSFLIVGYMNPQDRLNTIFIPLAIGIGTTYIFLEFMNWWRKKTVLAP